MKYFWARFLALGLTVTVIVTVSERRAFAADVPTHGPDAEADARAHFSRGQALFEARDFDAALVEFLESRKLVPRRSNTLNAGICLRELRRYDEALGMFEALRTLANDASSLAEANDQIATVASFVGELDVRVTERDAIVTVDDRPMEARPDGSRRVRAKTGTHVVRVVKSGFVPVELQVAVTGGRVESRSVELAPLALSGRLTITEDEGRPADVVLDGIVIGVAPFQGSVAPGDHTVFLRSTGRLGSQPAQVTVKLNQATRATLALEELTAGLHVTVQPSDAQLSIDGVTLGHGTWEGRLRRGPHKLEVLALGFAPRVEALGLRDGENARTTISLERDLSSPVWASRIPNRFFVDGAMTGLVGLALGGDARSACSGACSATIPTGLAATLRVGYQLRSGFAFDVEGGVATLRARVEARPTSLGLVGAPAEPGVATEQSRIDFVPIGAGASYRIGEKIRTTVRLGLGVWVGSVVHDRSATFGATSYAADTATTRTSFTYAYVRPSVRVGWNVVKALELYVDGSVTPAFGIDAPREAQDTRVRANAQFGYYPAERLMGDVVVLAAMSIGARVDF